MAVYLDMIYLTLLEVCLQHFKLLPHNRDQLSQKCVGAASQVTDCADILVLKAVDGDCDAVEPAMQSCLLNLQKTYLLTLPGRTCLPCQTHAVRMQQPVTSSYHQGLPGSPARTKAEEVHITSRHLACCCFVAVVS